MPQTFPNPAADIYDPVYVEQLFNKMAGTYERVNTISSFGFSVRWRRQFIAKLEARPGTIVCDLMTGMGECWIALNDALPESCTVIAIDNSEGMLIGARAQVPRFPALAFEVVKENALNCHLPDSSVDWVISGFGVKTFNPEQLRMLAKEIHRILKPGGQFSIIEVSIPKWRLLRVLYKIHLHYIIPIVGKVFLGDPQIYRMLWTYAASFGDCREFESMLARVGLDVQYHEYFFGCATGVSGRKR